MLVPILKDILQPMLTGMFAGQQCFALNFDSVDDYGQLATRAIDPDGDNVIIFWSPNFSNAHATIVAQNISSTQSLREFQLWKTSTNNLAVVLGGTQTTILTPAQGFEPNRKFKLDIVGAEAIVSIFDGEAITELNRQAVARGVAREPTAVTTVGARSSGVGALSNFYSGVMPDLEINGTYWPMDSRGEAVQISYPSGNNMTLVNTTPEQWEQVSCNLRKSFDKNSFYSSLQDVDTFWLFGASIINNVAGVSSTDFTQLMQTEYNRRYGQSINIIDRGYSGQDLAQLTATWESIKSEITGQSNVAVYLDVLGNTVSANRPYSALTPAQLDTISTGYESLINSIRANGNVPIAIDLSFRNYDGVTYLDELLGSQPFNDAIVYPLTNTLCPESVFKGKPVTQWYNIILNCFDVGMADQVHPNQSGYWLLRNYIVDSIAALKGAIQPVVVPRRDDIAIGMQYQPKPFVVAFGGTSSNQVNTGVYGLQRVAQSVSDFSICNHVGYDWNPITVSTSFPAMRTNVSIPVTDETYSLTCSNLKTQGGSIASTTPINVVTLKGFNPNQPLTLRLAAYRNTTTDYIGEYTANGSAPIQINSKFTVGNEGATTNIGEIVTQADANGHVVISCRAVVNTAYLMGLEVVL